MRAFVLMPGPSTLTASRKEKPALLLACSACHLFTHAPANLSQIAVRIVFALASATIWILTRLWLASAFLTLLSRAGTARLLSGARLLLLPALLLTGLPLPAPILLRLLIFPFLIIAQLVVTLAAAILILFVCTIRRHKISSDGAV
jgi:hypothetical protein